MADQEHDKGLELNKIAASILLAGLLAMVAGTLAEILYHPQEPEKRGYQVEVAEGGEESAAQEEAEPDLGTLLAAASPEKGEQLTKACQACHTFEQGGANKVGPNLWGILGANKAHAADFAYSDGLKAMGGTWDYDALYAFLKNPKAYLPGTRMAFAGLKKPDKTADVVAYLRTLGSANLPLPAPAPVAEPAAEAGAASGEPAEAQAGTKEETVKQDAPVEAQQPAATAPAASQAAPAQDSGVENQSELPE